MPRGMSSHIKHCPVIENLNFNNKNHSGVNFAYETHTGAYNYDVFNRVIYDIFQTLLHEPRKFIWWLCLLSIFLFYLRQMVGAAINDLLSAGGQEGIKPILRYVGGEIAQGEQDRLQTIKG